MKQLSRFEIPVSGWASIPAFDTLITFVTLDWFCDFGQTICLFMPVTLVLLNLVCVRMCEREIERRKCMVPNIK